MLLDVAYLLGQMLPISTVFKRTEDFLELWVRQALSNVPFFTQHRETRVDAVDVWSRNQQRVDAHDEIPTSNAHEIVAAWYGNDGCFPEVQIHSYCRTDSRIHKWLRNPYISTENATSAASTRFMGTYKYLYQTYLLCSGLVVSEITKRG